VPCPAPAPKRCLPQSTPSAPASPARPSRAATAAGQPWLGPGRAWETQPPAENRKFTLKLNRSPGGLRHGEAAASHALRSPLQGKRTKKAKQASVRRRHYQPLFHGKHRNCRILTLVFLVFRMNLDSFIRVILIPGVDLRGEGGQFPCTRSNYGHWQPWYSLVLRWQGVPLAQPPPPHASRTRGRAGGFTSAVPRYRQWSIWTLPSNPS